MIESIDDPKIRFEAALYFLDGHYLYRRRKGSTISSKFVTAADARAAFSGEESDSGWLPAGVVRAGSNPRGPFFVYSAPAQKTEIWLGEERLTIPLPRTVLIGNGRETWLFVLNAEHFLRDALALVAPFPNINDDGRICWGTSAAPNAAPGQARKIWELFFETVFNRDLAARKCESYPGNVGDLLRDLAKRGARKFPANELMTTGRTIGAVVDQILGGRHVR